MALSQSETAVSHMCVGLTRSLLVSGWLPAKTLVWTRGINSWVEYNSFRVKSAKICYFLHVEIADFNVLFSTYCCSMKWTQIEKKRRSRVNFLGVQKRAISSILNSQDEYQISQLLIFFHELYLKENYLRCCMFGHRCYIYGNMRGGLRGMCIVTSPHSTVQLGGNWVS